MSSSDDFMRILNEDVVLEKDLIEIYLRYYGGIKDDYLRLKIREMMLAGEAQIKIAKDISDYVKDNKPDFPFPDRRDVAADKTIPDELTNFKPSDCIIVQVKPDEYSDFVLDSVKHLVNDLDFNCTYLSITKPVQVLRKIMDEATINTQKVGFIEVASTSEAMDSISPSNLTEMSIEVDSRLKDMENPKLLVVDTLSALKVYNKAEVMTDFVSVMSKKAKTDNFGLIWLQVQSETEHLEAVTQTFVDKVVEY